MRYAKVPHPGEVLWTIDTLCLLFQKRPRTLIDLLWKRADNFSPPMYIRLGRGGPRRRVLTARDVNVLRTFLRVDISTGPSVRGSKIA
jgi:hypothetical protein